MASVTICYDLNGRAVPVDRDKLRFRPAVYGLFLDGEQILLVKHPITHLWHPPGGIVPEEETPAQAVRHFFRRVTGMTPRLGPLVFIEDQYRIDETEQAYHLSVLYYALSQPDATHAALSEVEKSTPYAWLPLAELPRSALQLGYEAIHAARLWQREAPQP